MNQVARLSLVDRTADELSIVAQCRLLKVARSTLYWRPAAVSEDDLRLMRQIDEQYLATPFYGSRRMVAVLRRAGWTAFRWREPSSPKRGLVGEPQTGAAADAPDADRGDLPAAEHQPQSPGSYCLSLFFAWSGDRPAEPGLVRGHHLHSDGQRLCLSGRGDLAFRSRHVNVPKRRDGLVQSSRSGLAFIDRHGDRVLCRGVAGGTRSLRFT